MKTLNVDRNVAEGFSLRIREIFVEQLRKCEPVLMKIKGNCMHPFIKKGDIVTVKPIRFDEAKTGDVIVYDRSLEQDFTVHRLIRKRRDRKGREFLFTKADASIHGDFPVYPEDLYGKVVTIERKNGRIVNLETKFNCLSSYFIAYLSWFRAILKEAIIYPSRFLKRVRKYFFKKVDQDRPLPNNCSG